MNRSKAESRRCFLKALSLAAAGSALAGYALAKSAKRPNIILLLADDLGYADMSLQKHSPPDIKTPGIDALAKMGTFFSDAYATAPICSPSRAGLITGRYQQRWGNYWYGQGGLPSREFTLPQALKKMGYVSKKIGKTHMNGGSAQHPLKHGFDEFFGFIDHTKDYVRLSQKDVEAYGKNGARVAHIGPLIRGEDTMESFENSYTTELFTKEAVEYINRDHGDNPFYLHVSHNAVHHPTYVGHPEYLKKQGIEQFPFWDPKKEPYSAWHKKWGHLGEVDPNGRKRYLATLEVLDDGIKAVLDAVKKKGLEKETIIIFLSDNGGTINTYSNNTPLRGYKYMFGEGGIRIPIIMAWPGKWAAGKRLGGLTSAMDIFPTLMDAVGGETPENLDGHSKLASLTQGKNTSHKWLAWGDGKGSWVVREGRWKLINSSGWNHSNYELENGECKPAEPYIYPAGKMLFDLKKDVGERTDLSKENPEVIERLTKLYEGWKAQMGKPVNGNKNG